MPEASLSLSRLHQLIADVVKREFPDRFWVVAEILELHVNRSGHCYLELIEKSEKDDAILARARATIWASRFSMLRPFFESATGTSLKSGIKLLFKASVEFHTLYGYSLNITDIDPSYTVGDLARKKQEVIRRLREQGVIEMNRELPFPAVPQRIAVISSETAAGYGDFMETIENNSHRFRFETVLFPALMQGEEAAGSMIAALEAIFEQVTAFDCVAIIRGGGSKADLECYNEYELAYFITQFPLPVITGIGHERDETVADLVANRGLKTPTAVAEFLVDQMLAFEFLLSSLHERMTGSVKRIVQLQAARLERYGRDLQHLSHGFIHRRQEHLEQSRQLLRRLCGTFITRRKDHLAMLEKQAALVDPANIMKRGYSMTLREGKLLKSVRGVKAGDRIETWLSDGRIISNTEKIKKKNGQERDQL
ncbi:MAG TPA: exodeoxyribonuclease VII large subunit [Bacteroides sp.]|nr:exodeoxyribonuclease VII large subunit [Bacteroides sp.]